MSCRPTRAIVAKRANTARPSVALTAFIDLLGFSQQALSVRSVADLERLIKKVRVIRDYFDHEPTDPTTREAQRISKTEVLAFSDCVVISIGLDLPAIKVQGEFDIWAHDLHAMAYAQAQAVAAGHLIRGGIDKGLWYHDREGVLVSPALVKAYRLEHAANYPVLAVGDALYKFLRDHPGRRAYSKDLDPIPRMFRSFTYDAGTTFRYLNYIELLIYDVDWQFDQQTVQAYRAAPLGQRDAIAKKGLRRNVERFFRAHKKAIEAAYRRIIHKRIKSKYVFLRDYHNEMVKKYLPKSKGLDVTLSSRRSRRMHAPSTGQTRSIRRYR